MADGEDWLFRPAVRGLMRAESLFDGSVSLGRVALLNEALDVNDENSARAQKALAKK